jgi:SlyX protein
MNDTENLSGRIEALEMRAAHQERIIEDLNQTITAQWQQIDRLTREIARLGDQIREAEAAAASSGPEAPPPHY